MSGKLDYHGDLFEQYMKGYEFFIAYASSNHDEAQDLFWELEDRGRSVFFDTAALHASERWDQKLKDAIEQSVHVIVLVSRDADKAHYAQDEVARAIERSRASDGRCAVIPVLLQKITNRQMPYGLAALQAIDGSLSGGMKRVAKAIDKQFPQSAMASVVWKSTYELAAHTIRLNRSQQWGQILEASYHDENNVFLFHGPAHQNVGLFATRLEAFFQQSTGRPMMIGRIPFNLDGATPRTGEDWLGHFRESFGCDGPLCAYLQRKVNQGPLLAILCDMPLPAEALKPAHVQALQAFVQIHWPKLLHDIRSPTGLSLMLTFDYENEAPALIADIERWGETAESTGLLRFWSLAPAALPTWDEVNQYLTGLRPRPASAALLAIRTGFEALAARPTATFDQLGRLIDIHIMLGD